jgi:hypothetical protein
MSRFCMDPVGLLLRIYLYMTKTGVATTKDLCNSSDRSIYMYIYLSIYLSICMYELLHQDLRGDDDDDHVLCVWLYRIRRIFE